MTSSVITLDGFELAADISPATSETGREMILAFHGFGRPPSDFQLFLPLLKPNQELISIGLFGHGTSRLPRQMNPNKPLDQDVHHRLFVKLLNTRGAERASLLAYSMGGRVSLALAESFPDTFDRLLLIAPDGFRSTRMYGPLFGTAAGRQVYRYTEKNPKWVFSLTEGLHRAGVLAPKSRQFIKAHFSRPEQRRNIREAWSLYRCFDPDLDQLAQLVNDNRVHMNLIFGSRDSVIPPKLGERFDQKVNAPVLHIMESGHLILTPSLLNFIREKDLWFAPR